MRAVLHAGTRPCRVALDDAVAGHLGALAVVVPAEPRLLGALAGADGIDEDLAAVAAFVGEHAATHARHALARERRSIGQVFEGAGATPAPDVGVHVVNAPVETHLPTILRAEGARELYAARATLRLLEHAGVDVAAALGRAGCRLVAR